MKEQAQNITLYFYDSNGRQKVVEASVPAFDENVEGLRLRTVTISLPYDLPEDCEWGRWKKP